VRRWNGWGHAAVSYPLPETAASVLAEKIGPGTPPHDVSLHEVMASVPPSRLPPHPLVSTEPELRVRHARGQSFPDLIALRSGRVPAFPDGVARPRDSEEVRALFDYARERPLQGVPGAPRARWLLRRVRLGLLLPEGGSAHLPALRALCQRELGWDDARWDSEARAYLTLWRTHYALPEQPRLPALMRW
jgi:hypothetical protein